MSRRQDIDPISESTIVVESDDCKEINDGLSGTMSIDMVSIAQEDYKALLRESCIDGRDQRNVVNTVHPIEVYSKRAIDRKFKWIRRFIILGFIGTGTAIHSVYESLCHKIYCN